MPTKLDASPDSAYSVYSEERVMFFINKQILMDQEVVTMVTQKELCKKIESIHPEMGVCGVDFDVEFDQKVKAWAVDFHQGRQHLRTFVEIDEADSCLEEDRCHSLALQIGQLRRNFIKYTHEHALENDH